MLDMSFSQNFPTFQSWLAEHWKTDSGAVSQILADPLAVHFLISWSIFESGFFVGREQFSAKIEAFAKSYPKDSENEQLLEAAKHFHERYQDRTLYDSLMHTQKCKKLELLIHQKEFDELNSEENIFLLVWVVFRYRNNIFHGNKGVQSWLKYQVQIEFCVSTMQSMIDARTNMQNAAAIS